MSNYEFFNQKVDERRAAAINHKRKVSITTLIRILYPLALALALFAVLEGVGFINNVFSAIMAVIAISYGSFKIGCAWHRIKW